MFSLELILNINYKAPWRVLGEPGKGSVDGLGPVGGGVGHVDSVGYIYRVVQKEGDYNTAAAAYHLNDNF